jgi:hypothetical protein
MHPTNRRATVQLTQPTRAAREPDPVTGAPHHPLRTGNRPHRAPLSKTALPFSSPLLLQFLLLAPSATPPLRNPPRHRAFVEGRGLSRFRPALVVRSPPPTPRAVRSVHRSPSSSSLEDSVINDIALDPASSSAPLTRFLSTPGVTCFLSE